MEAMSRASRATLTRAHKVRFEIDCKFEGKIFRWTGSGRFPWWEPCLRLAVAAAVVATPIAPLISNLGRFFCR